MPQIAKPAFTFVLVLIVLFPPCFDWPYDRLSKCNSVANSTMTWKCCVLSMSKNMKTLLINHYCVCAPTRLLGFLRCFWLSVQIEALSFRIGCSPEAWKWQADRGASPLERCSRSSRRTCSPVRSGEDRARRSQPSLEEGKNKAERTVSRPEMVRSVWVLGEWLREFPMCPRLPGQP